MRQCAVCGPGVHPKVSSRLRNVVLLADGLSLDEASEALGMSRNTARTHLRSIFSKTGVSRQTLLVRLILKSVAQLAD